MAQMITVDISAAGSVKIDAQGYTGNACDKATHDIELVLGGGTQAKKDKKPEYYAPPVDGSQHSKLTF